MRSLAAYIKSTSTDKFTSIEPVEKRDYYALSSAQKRLYILQQMALESIAYNISQAVPLTEEPVIEKLENTFIKLIKHHESFRTSFHMIANEPVQRIHDKVEFKIEYYDSAAGVNDDKTHHSFIRPFDLSHPPLLRVGLVKAPQMKYLLLVDMHHIIADGTSCEVLKNDFEALYEDETLPLLRIQYKDFSEWQNRGREKENLKRQEEYWLKVFKGKIPTLNLPMDYPRPEIQTFEGRTSCFEILGKENEALNKIVSEVGATLFMAYLAITNIFLSKISGQEDIVIGTPTAGRRHADLEPIMGMFVNTLALRNYPVGEKTFREFLEEIKKRTLEAFDNQDFQLEDLVDHVLVHRDSSRNPLFDLLFTLATNYGISKQPGGNEKKESKIPDWDQSEDGFLHTTSKFDLKIVGVEQKRKMVFTFEYNTKLFKKQTIERFISYYKNIIFSAAAHPDRKILEIDISSKDERKRLMKKMRAEKDKQFIDEIDPNCQSYREPEVEFDF
jgi:hypothetical protein